MQIRDRTVMYYYRDFCHRYTHGSGTGHMSLQIARPPSLAPKQDGSGILAGLRRIELILAFQHSATLWCLRTFMFYPHHALAMATSAALGVSLGLFVVFMAMHSGAIVLGVRYRAMMAVSSAVPMRVHTRSMI